MTSVQAINATTFTSRKNKNTENSHAGLKIGSGLAAAEVAGATATTVMIKQLGKKGDKLFEQAYGIDWNHFDAQKIKKIDPEILLKLMHIDKLTKSLKQARKSALIIAPIMVACGAIVDYFNNKQRKNLAPNALTKDGNEYTKVNMGKKVGAALGAAATAGLILTNKNVFKAMKGLPKSAQVVSTLVTAAYGALGGFALGAATDAISNRKAAKKADKAA